MCVCVCVCVDLTREYITNIITVTSNQLENVHAHENNFVKVVSAPLKHVFLTVHTLMELTFIVAITVRYVRSPNNVLKRPNKTFTHRGVQACFVCVDRFFLSITYADETQRYHFWYYHTWIRTSSMRLLTGPANESCSSCHSTCLHVKRWPMQHTSVRCVIFNVVWWSGLVN